MGRVSDALKQAGYQKPIKSPSIAGLLVTGEVIANMAYEDGLRHNIRSTEAYMQQRARAAYPNDPEQAELVGSFFHECYLIGYEEGSRQ